MLAKSSPPSSTAVGLTDDHPVLTPLQDVLDWIHNNLLPNLEKTTDEINNLLHGLNGGYVPSGPSGAPTRNRPEVLPTGRNFYSGDIRAIPTESAWDVGRKAAEELIENYTQEQGEYPKTLGLSMWGTAAMRTGGDDLAEALAITAPHFGTAVSWGRMKEVVIAKFVHWIKDKGLESQTIDLTQIFTNQSLE